MEYTDERHRHDTDRVKVGITHGDMNGIGYEIIMKTFHDQRMLESITPVVYGSSKVASYHRKSLNISEINFNLVKNAASVIHRRMNIVNVIHDEVKIDLGKSTEIAGQLAFKALETATQDLLQHHIDVLVTAPINKKNMQTANFRFPGHSEYLSDKAGGKEHLMLMVCDKLRVGVITGHIPLKDVPEALTTELILRKIELLHRSLIRDFGIRKPKIALLGLNPHAGDLGVIGEEDQKVIAPAVEQAWNKNIIVYGPYSADGFFGSNSYVKFDGILAMYHDQGMIPFKTLSFDRGVNFTAGLPFIRTSPAHGTAYDIAGKNLASHVSFREAVYLAIDIFNNRKEFDELNNKPLQNFLKDIESSSDAVIEKEIPGAADEAANGGLVAGQ
ncbi:MAG: 4-hydroxythreonine-4-phosphate dehydrogenase PdxA [Bacteroidales bacterium]|jgi:4-hydroxythreonine-4-phosphate dehydrogenase|nr:4-hydroxythreonine-4-phosphate dehydrogenase PdxA [Bacteroidales bacterium]